mmetsp:Transcript_10064/g.20020  ORF Transcript_10064/g.20020 Transcript_10064/m.20020 type:complete len:224 (+) Transcript_10064:878-1549(+)
MGPGLQGGEGPAGGLRHRPRPRRAQGVPDTGARRPCQEGGGQEVPRGGRRRRDQLRPHGGEEDGPPAPAPPGRRRRARSRHHDFPRGRRVRLPGEAVDGPSCGREALGRPHLLHTQEVRSHPQQRLQEGGAVRQVLARDGPPASHRRAGRRPQGLEGRGQEAHEGLPGPHRRRQGRLLEQRRLEVRQLLLRPLHPPLGHLHRRVPQGVHDEEGALLRQVLPQG